ncbi:MAG: peptidylprolyl isomerase, partial [Saprospiraceae bacterium]
ESDTDTKLALIQAIGKTKTVESKDLILETIKNATDDRMAASAIKVINNFEYSIAKPVILDALKSSSITTASAAINYLNDYSREADANDYRNIAREDLPWQVKVPLLGIANKNYSYAYAITKGNVNGELKSIFNRSLNLTEKAACIRALAEDPKNIIFLLETARNSQLAPINSAVMESSLNALKNKYFSPAFGGGGDDIKKQVISFVYDQLVKGDEAALEIIESAAKDENQKKLIDASKIESIKSSLSSNVYAQHMLMRTLNALKGTNDPVPLMSNYKKLTSNDFALDGIPHIVEFVTDKGNIKIKLFPETAPATVLNFVQLAKNEFFNNKIFHRVVPNFVIQGGCPRGDGYGSMDYSIRSETPQIYYNKPGMVGMASSGPHTESCQFFITNSPTPHLDGKYTIFAEVISGQDVVNKIQIGDKIQRINLSE